MRLRESIHCATLHKAIHRIAGERLNELRIVYGIADNTLADAVRLAIDTAMPHVTAERPAFTAIIPFVWKPVRPYAVGANVNESSYSEARFSLSVAVAEGRSEPLVVLAILRQADARTASGGIYLHNLMAGVRQRAYVYDESYSLKASIDPRIARRREKARNGE